jgi:TIR domain
MADVFISYAREDRVAAERIAGVISKHGWSIWWDRKIRFGRSFSRVIQHELDAARCVIVLWSQASIDSDWVLSEAAEGARRNVLMPICIQDVRPPLEFRRLHTASLFSEQQEINDAVLHECISALHELLARPAPTNRRGDAASRDPQPAAKDLPARPGPEVPLPRHQDRPKSATPPSKNDNARRHVQKASAPTRPISTPDRQPRTREARRPTPGRSRVVLLVTLLIGAIAVLIAVQSRDLPIPGDLVASSTQPARSVASPVPVQTPWNSGPDPDPRFEYPGPYDPQGRRDPFRTLSMTPVSGNARAPGLTGFRIAELTLLGVLRTKTGLVAMLLGPDGKNYLARAGDTVADGAVRQVNTGSVTFFTTAGVEVFKNIVVK